MKIEFPALVSPAEITGHGTKAPLTSRGGIDREFVLTNAIWLLGLIRARAEVAINLTKRVTVPSLKLPP